MATFLKKWHVILLLLVLISINTKAYAWIMAVTYATHFLNLSAGGNISLNGGGSTLLNGPQ